MVHVQMRFVSSDQDWDPMYPQLPLYGAQLVIDEVMGDNGPMNGACQRAADLTKRSQQQDWGPLGAAGQLVVLDMPH
jgi:hypothetical protein